MTDLQLLAATLHGKHNGKISAIAQEMGVGHPTVIQHLKAVWKKLPHLAPKKTGPAGRTQRLPTDRRGQEMVTDNDGDFDDADDHD